MEEIEIAGQVMLPMGGGVVTMDYVNWQNRSWLAPVWIEDIASGQIRPLRLVAPRMAPGFSAPPGPELLHTFQQMPLPESLYQQGHIPAELANLVMVVENPPVFRTA
ncbi:hypothetical protein [Rhizobium ruizarguesonis]|uniref:hypothetical protein n=1 Tax=Rhizobium ruizarguesonis TaxID=2081791 RepID=UPI001031FAD6|nr:hypothetical protein [Rhizobium ruizarguesonis]TBE67441.1 hypothetical protein ELH00_16360 [Rhizobium ruizarguesonis]